MINLLPWRAQRREYQKKQFIKQAAICAAITLLIWLIWQCVCWVEIAYQNHKIQQLTVVESGLHHEFVRYQALVERQSRQTRISNYIGNKRKIDLAVLELLKELSVKMPAAVYLTKIENKGLMLQIDGKSPTHTDIAAMLAVLEKITHQPQALLKKTRRTNNATAGIDFSLSYPIAQ